MADDPQPRTPDAHKSPPNAGVSWEQHEVARIAGHLTDPCGPSCPKPPDPQPRTPDAGAAQRLTNAIRAHLDIASGNPSIPAYVDRLREFHRALLLPTGSYAGCACGKPLCQTAVLIVHIDNLTAAFEHSRAAFAAETLRSADLAAARSALARVEALVSLKIDNESVTVREVRAALAPFPADERTRPSTGPGWSCPACDGRMRPDQLSHPLALIHEGHTASPAEPDSPTWHHARWFEPHPAKPDPARIGPSRSSRGNESTVCLTCGEVLLRALSPSPAEPGSPS